MAKAARVISTPECDAPESWADIDASNLTVPIVGHVGDGNFHLLFLIDPANEAEDLKQFQQLNDRLIERALKM